MCTRCGIILQQRVFFVLHSCRPPGVRLASHFFQAGRRGSRLETEFINKFRKC